MFVHELGVGAVSVDGHSQQPVHYDVRVSAKTKTTNKKICLNYIYTKYTIGASMLRSTPNSYFAPHTALKVIFFILLFFFIVPLGFLSPPAFSPFNFHQLHKNWHPSREWAKVSSKYWPTLQEKAQCC